MLKIATVRPFPAITDIMEVEIRHHSQLPTLYPHGTEETDTIFNVMKIAGWENIYF